MKYDRIVDRIASLKCDLARFYVANIRMINDFIIIIVFSSILINPFDFPNCKYHVILITAFLFEYCSDRL